MKGILGMVLVLGLAVQASHAGQPEAAQGGGECPASQETPSNEPCPPPADWSCQPEAPPHQRLFEMLMDPGQCCEHMRIPLVRESWQYRPFSAGWFMGEMAGSPLIDDWVGLSHGFFGGYRFGWDFDHYWGVETRFSFGSVALYDSQQAIEASRTAPRIMLDGRRDADVLLWDLNLLYYPWGDEVWRPYLMAGLGTARVDFEDKLAERYNSTVFAVPVGVGVKYRCNNWLALRFELADNIAFGTHSPLETQHNLSITGGMEVRFGGSRTAYWPYNPGRSYW